MDEIQSTTEQAAPGVGEKKGLSTSTKVIIGILVAMVGFGIMAAIGVMILISVVSKNIMNGQLDSSYEWSYEDGMEYYDYSSSSGSWQPFDDNFGRFSVEVPSYPYYETNSTPVTGTDISVWYDMYSAEEEDAFYTVTVAEYPADIDLGEPEDNLQNALDSLLLSSSASLITSEMTSLQGNTALHYIAQTTDGIYLEGKSIVQGQVLYQVMVAYDDGDATAERRAKFFDSFVLNQ